MQSSPATKPPALPPASVCRWWRVFPIALPLVVLDAFWVIYAEKVGTGPYFTTISIFANIFFILTGLLVINAGLRRWVPSWSLSQAELLLIYAMVGVGAALAGHDMLPVLVQFLGHPYQFGNEANGWIDHFGRYLPTALMVSDKAALKGYYEGHSSLYRPENWTIWLRPTLLWSGFTLLLFGTMQFLNVLVRQGWQDRERLPFPVIEIPLQMTEPNAKLWRSGLFWAGFALCAAIEILNGLASFYPSLPTIQDQHVNLQGQGLFATRPWNAAGFTCYSFYPFAIGLGYLLPLDLLFSCWFFYLTWKAQLILSAQLALDVKPDFPFVVEQEFGGYMAILVFMFWNSRNYFRQVWRRIWHEPSDVTDAGEAVSYRFAFFGTAGGFVALTGFMWWAGLSPLVGGVAFAIYFALSLAVTRMRAELGPPVHDLHFSGPDYTLTHGFGTPAFSGRDLTLLSFFYWFNRAHRSNPQPVAIEGLKASKQVGSSQQVMFWGMMLAALVGSLSAFWAFLHFAYTDGVSAKFHQGVGFGNEMYNRLNGWVQNPTPPNRMANVATLVGFLFCALLMIARTRLAWWPFHPIGYAISGSWSMNLVWMPLLIAWVIKGLLLRYGGVRLYRQCMPFFLGLILGQMIVGSAWHLIGWAMNVTPYSFWGG